MEKINVAELLHNCPSGMELDCTMYDNLHFDKVDDYDKKIHCYIQYKDHRTHIMFGKDGTYNSEKASKCVIFPKGKTTWEGFVPPCQFKNGDIVTWKDRGSLIAFIYKERKNVAVVNYHFALYTGGIGALTDGEICLVESELVFATEYEKAKLFKAIRDNGYKWNPKTKTLENLFSYNIGKKVWVKSDKEHKYIHTIVGISRNSFGNLEYEVKEEKSGVVVHYPESLLIPIETKEPKFKVGDKIRHKDDKTVITITGIKDDYYFVHFYNIRRNDYQNEKISFKDQDKYELVSNKSIEPQFKVGDTITNGKTSITIGYIDNEYYYEISRNIAHRLFIKNQDDWELVPDKFDITTLKPFDKVLVRDFDNTPWEIEFFSRLLDEKHFKCFELSYMQCIPYEGNEHLLGKVDDCDKYFKTWE